MIGFLWRLKPLVKSSRPEVFCKKGALKNFTKFARKHLCQSLCFNKVAGLAKILVNFAKFLRKPFFIEHLRLLLLSGVTWTKALDILNIKLAG